MMTKEAFIGQVIANGDTRENAVNTWNLMEKIQQVLDDKDVDPYDAPELVHPKKVRLARLFIEELKAARAHERGRRDLAKRLAKHRTARRRRTT